MPCGCKKGVRRAAPAPANTSRMKPAADPIVAAASVSSYIVVNAAGRRVHSTRSLAKAELWARRIQGTVLPE